MEKKYVNTARLSIKFRVNMNLPTSEGQNDETVLLNRRGMTDAKHYSKNFVNVKLNGPKY